MPEKSGIDAALWVAACPKTGAANTAAIVTTKRKSGRRKFMVHALSALHPS
jgi:hypothetical protein